MPTVTLFNENRQSHLEIRRVAYESYDLSQSLVVTVVHDSFQGAVRAWVDDSNIRRFVRQLRECEETRRGEANLYTMSPEDFTLRIFNTHSKGDFALTYAMSETNSHYPTKLQGGFVLDPSLLLQMLRDFEDFLILD